MINVQVASKSYINIESLVNRLTKEKNIEVTDVTYNSSDTINSYTNNYPHILILDLNSLVDVGIDIICRLTEYNLNEQNKCNIIVLCENPANFKIKNARKIFCSIFDCNSYNDILRSIYEIENSYSRKPNFHRHLCNVAAMKLGFNVTSLGTAYLIDTIIALYENNWTILDVKKAYEYVGKNYATTPDKVKWSIEKSINSMYKYTNQDKIVAIFPQYDGRKPSTKYAIELALTELKEVCPKIQHRFI